MSGGTTFCVISCDAAYESVVFTTELDPSAACRALARAVSSQYARVRVDEVLGKCGYVASLPRPDGAFVRVDAGAAGDLTGTLAPEEVGHLSAGMSARATVAWLVFDSGLD